MANRYERILIFQETQRVINETPFLADSTKNSILNQEIVWQEDAVNYSLHRDHPAKVLLSPKRTLEAASFYSRKGYKVCVLNFASSVTPGGGVMKGASAQEESLCRISTLYPAINDISVSEFYSRHKQMIHAMTMGRENRDDCIYTPGVYVIREDTFDCELLPPDQWYKVDVITCAAPDLREDTRGFTYHPSEEELIAVHKKRFDRILSIAAKHEAEVVILGAFGCGVFANPPEIVVKAINQVIGTFVHCFCAIEFAVFTSDIYSDNYQAFRHITGVEEKEFHIRFAQGE